MRRGLSKMIGAAAVLALVAGACGDDDDDGAEAPADGGEQGEEPSGEPITIGVVTSLNGPFTPWGLQVRRWQCRACRAVHDRDVNAARNILAAGRAERQNACGGTVSPPV